MPAVTALAPLVKQQFNQNGSPVAGGLLFTYAAGTTNKLTTYTNSMGTVPNTNPIVLDSNGQCDLWLVQGVAYKLVLSPSTDTDPPTNPYWTEDNIQVNASIAVGNMTDEKGLSGTYGFAANVDFTPNVSTTLTLSQPYGSSQNLWVAFDGDEQGADQYSLTGTTLTFTAPIPTGVRKVYVKGGTSLSVGTPGIGTVGPAQFAFPLSGTTAQRPAPLAVGQPYFDTTLGLPIVVKQLSPVIWVDGAGVQV